MKGLRSFLPAVLLPLLPALVFLAAWQAAVGGDSKAQFLYASPALVLSVAVEELGHAAIWRDIGLTCLEAVLGLMAGTVLGSLAGLLLWGNGRLDRMTRPLIALIGAMPIFALAPMTILWFGVGLLSKTVMAGFAVFFIALLQIYEGAHRAARDYACFARSLNAPQAKVIAKIIVPGALDWMLAGYRLNVGAALMGAFIGEFVSSEAGLGHYILKASSLYDVPRVLFGVGLICLIALMMTALAWGLQRVRGWRLGVRG